CWGAPGLLPPNPPAWNPSDPNQYVDCIAYGGYTGPTGLSTETTANPAGNGTTMSLTRDSGGGTFSLATPTPTYATPCPPPTTTTTTPTTTTPSTTATTSPPQTISGKKLLLKTPADPTKSKVVALSKDGGITLGGGNGSGDDPTTAGGSLRVVTT